MNLPWKKSSSSRNRKIQDTRGLLNRAKNTHAGVPDSPTSSVNFCGQGRVTDLSLGGAKCELFLLPFFTTFHFLPQPGGGEELLEEAASDAGKRKNLGTQRSTPHTGNYRVQHKDLRQMSKDQHHSGKSPTRADPQLTRDLQSAIPTKICTPYVLWKQIKKSKQVSSSAFCSESG